MKDADNNSYKNSQEARRAGIFIFKQCGRRSAGAGTACPQNDFLYGPTRHNLYMKHAILYKYLPGILLALSVTVLQACSVIRTVQVDSPTWDCVGSGQHFCHDTLIRTSIWKGKNAEKLSSGCATGISRMKVTTKPGDIFLGVFTAGFIIRQRIEWDCAQRSGASDM